MTNLIGELLHGENKDGYLIGKKSYNLLMKMAEELGAAEKEFLKNTSIPVIDVTRESNQKYAQEMTKLYSKYKRFAYVAKTILLFAEGAKNGEDDITNKD